MGSATDLVPGNRRQFLRLVLRSRGMEIPVESHCPDLRYCIHGDNAWNWRRCAIVGGQTIAGQRAVGCGKQEQIDEVVARRASVERWRAPGCNLQPINSVVCIQAQYVR